MNLISSVHSLKSVTALYPILCIKIETVVNLAMREFEKCLCLLTPLDIIPSSNLKRPNIPLSPDHLSIKMHDNLFDASVKAKLSLTISYMEDEICSFITISITCDKIIFT